MLPGRRRNPEWRQRRSGRSHRNSHHQWLSHCYSSFFLHSRERLSENQHSRVLPLALLPHGHPSPSPHKVSITSTQFGLRPRPRPKGLGMLRPWGCLFEGGRDHRGDLSLSPQRASSSCWTKGEVWGPNDASRALWKGLPQRAGLACQQTSICTSKEAGQPNSDMPRRPLPWCPGRSSTGLVETQLGWRSLGRPLEARLRRGREEARGAPRLWPSHLPCPSAGLACRPCSLRVGRSSRGPRYRPQVAFIGHPRWEKLAHLNVLPSPPSLPRGFQKALSQPGPVTSRPAPPARPTHQGPQGRRRWEGLAARAQSEGAPVGPAATSHPRRLRGSSSSKPEATP